MNRQTTTDKPDLSKPSLEELLDDGDQNLKQLEFLQRVLGIDERRASSLALSVFCFIAKAAGENGCAELRAGGQFACTLSAQNGYGPQKGTVTHSLTLTLKA